MPRIRTITPHFPQTASLAGVSREARLFFIQLWTVADDAGRLELDHERLKDQLYPFDTDAPSLLPVWIGELESARCIELYRVDDVDYLCVRKWRQWQTCIQHPSHSQLPAAPHEAHEPHEESPRMQKARASKANPPEFSSDELNDTGEAGKDAVLRDLRRVQEQAEADRSHTAALRSIELRGRRIGLWDGKRSSEKESGAPRSPSPAEVHGLSDTSD
jgi:hypothetical protein